MRSLPEMSENPTLSMKNPWMGHKDTFVHPETKIHDFHQFRVLRVCWNAPMVFIFGVLALPMGVIDCESLRVIGIVLLEKSWLSRFGVRMRHKDTFVHPDTKIHDKSDKSHGFCPLGARRCLYVSFSSRVSTTMNLSIKIVPITLTAETLAINTTHAGHG